MSSDKTIKQTADDLKSQVDLLVRILAIQIESHRRLFSSIQRKREAIRTADLDAIAGLTREENALIQRMGELEKRRLELIGSMTGQLTPDADNPLTVMQIAEAVGEPQKRELQDLAEKLRECVHEVRRESSIVRTAAEALDRHMTGIAQTINGVLSRVGLYERRGRIAVGAQVNYCVDIKS